jgi:hypothetical protein
LLLSLSPLSLGRYSYFSFEVLLTQFRLLDSRTLPSFVFYSMLGPTPKLPIFEDTSHVPTLMSQPPREGSCYKSWKVGRKCREVMGSEYSDGREDREGDF